MAYSLDLRKRVLAAVDRGMSRTQAARQFQVGRATITIWVRLRRERGSLAAQSPPGRPRTIGPADHDALWAQLTAQADATLPAHVASWAAQYPAPSLSVASMSRAIRRLDWTRKKSRSAPASKTPSAARPSKPASGRGQRRTSRSLMNAVAT
jgi:transposase